jgi:DNA-binding transcriptional regulator YhcF (GntR family)
MQTLFSGLITSRTRIEILMRLFLNPNRRAHLRELAGELAVSPSQVQSELQNLSASGLVRSAREGNRLQFAANQAHPLFPELNSMVRKALGMDRILESIVTRLGRLRLALLIGDYASGKDSGCIDLVLVGDIDQHNLADLVAKTERQLSRKIRVQVLSPGDYASLSATLAAQPHLLLWAADGDTEADALSEMGAVRQDSRSTTRPGASTLGAPSAATSDSRDRP